MSYPQETINYIADEIKKKIKGGNLFGEPINVENINHLIVASNFLAQYEKYAQQSVYQTAFRRDWRGRLGNWFISLGNYIAKSGGW